MILSRITRMRGSAYAIVALLAGIATAYPLEAQQPAAPQQPQLPATTSAVLAPYRAPMLALVQPATGSVTQDKPVVVFRFAQGEPTDPIDLASFAVSVDGEDRTGLFQVATQPIGEAWGPLADAAAAQEELAVGAHIVAARICTTRGLCGTLQSTMTVMPPVVAPTDNASGESHGKVRRLIGAILSAPKKIVAP